MNLKDTLELYGGGMGSRCNNEKGPCGRRPKSLSSKKMNADQILSEAEEMYADKPSFKVMRDREIRDAYGNKIHGWKSLTAGQKMTIAKRCHAKAQDRMRASKKSN